MGQKFIVMWRFIGIPLKLVCITEFSSVPTIQVKLETEQSEPGAWRRLKLAVFMEITRHCYIIFSSHEAHFPLLFLLPTSSMQQKKKSCLSESSESRVERSAKSSPEYRKDFHAGGKEHSVLDG